MRNQGRRSGSRFEGSLTCSVCANVNTPACSYRLQYRACSERPAAGRVSAVVVHTVRHLNPLLLLGLFYQMKINFSRRLPCNGPIHWTPSVHVLQLGMFRIPRVNWMHKIY